MWGSLRKDFGEFVATVATDATDVLQQLDQGMDDNGDGGRGEAVSLIDPDTGMPIEYDATDEPTTETSSSTRSKSMPPPPVDATVEEMKTFLMTLDNVFLDVIDIEDDPDAAAFVQSFNIDTKTEEISTLLDTHKDSLEPTFSRLVDQVEYVDFWQRYFYRIDGGDEERLKANYLYYYDQHMQSISATKNPQVIAKKALSNVTNFLGGVVHRLVDENDADDSADDDEEVIDEEDDINNNINADGPSRFGSSTAAAVNFLAGSVNAVRPSFGLPMARSFDNQDGRAKSEDDGEEEELGWDDDDDDEDDSELPNDEDDDDDDDQNETVEFKDAEKEKLQEELAQAQEERDMLHKTVVMQTEEIKRLRESIQPTGVAGGDESDQVKHLQMQLFEKDSELAALRAQLDDLKNDQDDDDKFGATDSSNTAVTAKEIKHLKDVIANQDLEIASLKQSHESSEQFKIETSATAIENTREIDRLKKVVAAKDVEIERLQAEITVGPEASAAATQAAHDISRLKEEIAIKESMLMEMETSKATESSELRSQLDRLRSEKEEVRTTLQLQIDDLRQARESDPSDGQSDWEAAMASKDKQIATLTESLTQSQLAIQANSNLQQQLDAIQEERSRWKSDASKSTEELTVLRQECTHKQATIDALRMELEHLKEREAEMQLARRPSSPGSSSTGVKVSTDIPDEPVAVVESKVKKSNAGGGEDDDGWGDDW